MAGKGNGSFSLKDEFGKYERLGEPDKAEKSIIWQTAIGLQQTDGLRTSDYLIELAKQNIEGEITIGEVKKRLDIYYRSRPALPEDEPRMKEADEVSSRISEILAEKAFNFSPAELITIHKRLFRGIYKFAGRIRDYNITKTEWVLDGKTVYYAGADSIRATLDYDFEQEKKFNYKGLTKRQTTEQIAKFASGIWQIHPFGEGNTRTTAVFIIKYLHTLGFPVTNDLFADNSWYFRNALVRANYSDHSSNIHPTYEYLNRFFGNLLLGESDPLRNRDLHVRAGGADNDAKNKAQNKAHIKRSDPEITLTAAETAVLEYLKRHPNATQIGTADAVGRSRRTVQVTISSLKEKGLIERSGSKKTGEWTVKE